MILCAILYVLNYSLLGSQSQGDPVYFLSARSLAMGGIGSILEEPGSFCRNAGALGLMNKATLNLSLRGLSHREQRSLRVYDPYANNMGLSTVFDYSSRIIRLVRQLVFTPGKISKLAWHMHKNGILAMSPARRLEMSFTS